MKLIKKEALALIVFSLVAIALYFPIFDNTFLSDDYDSLYRICVERTIIIKEFFRPLIDISFKLNYELGGLDSSGYYVFNLLIHIVNAYLVYTIAINLQTTLRDQKLFAWFSALFFLFYPFHNEGVVWLTGRLASISCLFALLSIRIMVMRMHKLVKACLIAAFYFAGLLAYESILLFPFIIFIFLWERTFSFRSASLMLMICVVTIMVYLLFRYYVSGVVYGEYGSRMIDNNPFYVGIKAAKTFGRTILPPSENSLLLTVLFILLLGTVAFLNRLIFIRHKLIELSFYIKLVLAFGVSMVIPMLFGISTRTSESDRLLYFPSVFLCMILAFVIVLLVQSKFKRVLSFSLLSAYFLCFLIMNNLNWEKASQLAKIIINKVQESNNKRIILINMPDEVEGAFVYRNGFNKAMVLNGVDTGKIHVNNYLSRLEYIELKDKIEPIVYSAEVFLPPVSKIFFLPNDSFRIKNLANGAELIFAKKETAVIYWDKTEIKQLF